MWRRAALAVAGAGGLAAAAASTSLALSDQSAPGWIHNRLPSRDEQLRKLSQGTAANPFDLLIIGGGARAWMREIGSIVRSGRVCAAAAAAAACSGASRSAPPPPPRACRRRHWHRLRCGRGHTVRQFCRCSCCVRLRRVARLLPPPLPACPTERANRTAPPLLAP